MKKLSKKEKLLQAHKEYVRSEPKTFRKYLEKIVRKKTATYDLLSETFKDVQEIVVRNYNKIDKMKGTLRIFIFLTLLNMGFSLLLIFMIGAGK